MLLSTMLLSWMPTGGEMLFLIFFLFIPLLAGGIGFLIGRASGRKAERKAIELQQILSKGKV